MILHFLGSSGRGGWRPRSRWRWPGAVLGAVLSPAPGSIAGAESPSPTGKTVAAIGLGQVDVEVEDRHKNASIVEAVESGRGEGDAAGGRPRRASAGRSWRRAAGMTLGAVQSVEEQPGVPFGSTVGGPNAYPAPFGKDKYCGDERRAALRA